MSLLFSTLLVLLPFISYSSSEIYYTKGSPHVKFSETSSLSGIVDLSRNGRPFNSFIGIPYAKVTERFKDAEPLTTPSWEGVYNAARPGLMCAQQVTAHHQMVVMGGEDCLNLNVFVPISTTKPSGGYPVMVYIHGGGFSVGSGIGFGPKYFMDEDVILITINYRLGIFGFLSTGDSAIPGNYGLKDQVLSLKWIKQNIEHFEGDPEKITVFGGGAGGASVHLLLLSQMGNGLFHRAISQSGSAMASFSFQSNPRKHAVKLASYFNCSTTASNVEDISSYEILDCLKALRVEEFNTTHLAFGPRWPFPALPLPFAPVKEPLSSTAFLTESPWHIIMDDSAPITNIPWMVGTTEDEGSSVNAGLILQNYELLKELNALWNIIAPIAIDLDHHMEQRDQDTIAQKIKKFYFQDKPISLENRDSLTHYYSDGYFVYTTRKAALETARRRGHINPVYLYQYSHTGVSYTSLVKFPLAPEELKKVGHGDELLMQFNLGGGAVPDFMKPDSPHDEFSKNFVKLWVSFAAHGRPTHFWGTSKNLWHPISHDEAIGIRPLHWYKLTSTPLHIEEGDDVKERAMFWEQLTYDHLLHSLFSNPSYKDKTEL